MAEFGDSSSTSNIPYERSGYIHETGEYEWIEDTHPSARERAFSRAEYTGGVFSRYLPPPQDFEVFGDTEYKVTIPVGPDAKDRTADEISELTSEKLTSEPFQQFYRHIDILARLAEPEKVAELLPVILKRTKDESEEFAIKLSEDQEQQEKYQVNTFLRCLGCIERCLDDPDLRLSRDDVGALFDYSLTFQPRIIAYALRFDRRNRAFGESMDVPKKLIDYLRSNVANPDNKAQDWLQQLLIWAPFDRDVFAPILIDELNEAETPEQMGQVVTYFAQVGGVERLRKILREHVMNDETFTSKFNEVFEFLGLDPEDPLRDLRQDVYEEIDFSEYAPNKQLQTSEEELLKKEFEGGKVLDIGCGTGRLVLALDGVNGLRVEGMDMVPKHIEKIKEQNPDAKVTVGSWFDMPYEDEEFDGAYCMGRSLTHNRTIPDMVSALKKMGRVIKDGGKLIVDMPNSQKGEIFEALHETMRICTQQGITKYVQEMIIDSPDKAHFFDRYVPIPLRFRLLAFLAGFQSEKIATHTYTAESGAENENIYWRLTKQNPPFEISDDMRVSIVRFLKGHGDYKTTVSFLSGDNDEAQLIDSTSMQSYLLQLGPKDYARPTNNPIV